VHAWFLGFVKSGLVVVNHPPVTHSDPGTFRPNRRWPGFVRGVPYLPGLYRPGTPDEPRASLAMVPNAPAVQDHLPPDEKFAFYGPLVQRDGPPPPAR
jgi:hypothetical protein